VNAVYEPPTERILRHLADDERRHVAAGEAILRHLATTPALQARARAWQDRLHGALEAAGGVTGAGLPAAARVDAAAPAPMLSDDAAEFIRLARAVEQWPMPEELETALRATGDALVHGDEAALRRWLAPDATRDPELGGRIAQIEPERHHVAAFAKIGRQRAIKIRLDGRRGAVTVLSRWAPGEDGWRAGLLELTAFVPTAPPA
jgi:hypothetical protein